MARVASFEFYDDPVAFTGASTCTINWVASTVTYPGVLNLSFAQLTSLVSVINELADQVVTDLDVVTEKVIYKADGTVAVTVSAVGDVVAGTITTVSPGASAFTKLKAKDLALGLQNYVLNA